MSNPAALWLFTSLLGCLMPVRVMPCVAVAAEGGAVEAVGQPGVPACFLLSVDAFTAVRVRLDQPIDLSVVTRKVDELPGKAHHAVRVDAFDFGPETVTLSGAGTYRLEVQEVNHRAGGKFTARIEAITCGLEEAGRWRDAERASSTARISRNHSDADAALSLWRMTGEAGAVARAHLLVGDIVLGEGNLARALSAYESAREGCLSLADIRCVAEASNNSGLVALRGGDIETSRIRLLEAAGHWRTLGQPVYSGLTVSNLGLLAGRTGEFEKALGFYFEARKLLMGRDAAALVRVLNNLGLTYLSLSEFARARAILDMAVREGKRLVPPAPSASVLGNLGYAYLLEGRYDRAYATLQMAWQQADAEKNRFARAAVLVNLGHTLRLLKYDAESRQRLNEGLEAARQVADRQVEGSALLQLGRLAAGQGSSAEARQLLEQSIKTLRSCGQRNLEFQSLVALAAVEHRAGDLQRAKSLAAQALELLESLRAGSGTPALRASYFSRKREVFDLLLEMAGPAAQEGFLLAERARGRALLDLLTTPSLDLAPKELVVEQSAIQRRISFLSTRLRQAGSSDVTLRSQLQILLAENDSVESRIREAVGPAASFGRPISSIDELRRRIPAGSVLLTFHLARDRSYLWLVEDSGQVRQFQLPGREVVEARALRAASLFNAHLQRRRSAAVEARFQTAWKQLSATLLGPLQGIRLPNRLIFVLDGALHGVAVAALRRPGFSQPIGLTHELLTVPSASFLSHLGEPPGIAGTTRPVLALVDPVFSARDPRLAARPAADAGLNLPRLPFTGEIDVLRSLLPPPRLDILRGFAANSLNLDRRRLENYSVLHLSTHTMIDDEEPQASHIALSLVNEQGGATGGLLHPQRLARWRLRNALVVLSSCDTALGKLVPGEGLAGFTNILLLAGASQLVLATSKVDGEASAEFFSHFYRGYFSSGAGNVESSLTRARRTMAASRRWSDPYYWASFTAIGAPSPPR
ncbi:MAG: CHAT domain-containing tetratricopeptide repeat protein [Bryobacteraceae bacterium]|nr:CHAT domain-containing tetratricopeptide repeat protein [Bryobacteraceae bacterium]